ncbi:MAG: Asp-tRNA(Asn)/Glu-tRNA(Gln) amidotransferase subunit GatA [Bacteriovoracaceae bacterium]|nr:Asp-tRNA(Asn)/Glu-tRNA(Gln) amidotransferase subunit GatA [Bacteriovoracaceae bacterium]
MIFSLHQKLKKREISSVEITQEAIHQAKKSNCNAFISLTEDYALEQAKHCDEKKEFKTYLTGIPFSLKDLFVTKGIRTTAGSKILYNYIPPYEGYISEKLQKAGSVLIGKVGCDEFGMGSTNEYTPYGPVLNPLNKEFIAGGSSGGSAASVAESSSFYSMGTDTGGSIRLPANFCGLVALKPSYGRVSRYGQIAFASSLDQSSPIAKTTLDVACIMEQITEHDVRDATHAEIPAMNIVQELLNISPHYLKGKKIGFTPSFIDSCQEEVKKSLLSALDIFKKLGAILIPVELPYAKYAVPTYYIIATSEASTNLARMDGVRFGLRKASQGNLEETYALSRTEGFGAEVKRRILLGTFSLSSGYYDAYYTKACKVRRLMSQDFENAFSQVDVIFSPVCASSAFKKGEAIKDSVQVYMNDLYTIPVNLAGLPALALPFGKGAEGMPTGFQLIAKSFQDEELLRWGQAFEKAQGVSYA